VSGWILLPITVNPRAPLSITVQIAEQIKLLIATKQLKPGDSLPTVTQLAESLQTNHNTTATVYTQLIEAGYLTAQRGKGTFVAQTEVVQRAANRQHFYELLDRAFQAGTQMGLNASDFGAAAYARAVMQSQQPIVSPKLVFVESSQQDVDAYIKPIQSVVGTTVTLVQLEDLQAGQPVAREKLRAADMVIARTHRIPEITRITAPDQEVIGVGFEAELQLLEQVATLGDHSLVLLVCREVAGVENLKQMLERAGIFHVYFQAAGIEDIQKTPQLTDKAELICASSAVYDYVRKLCPQPEKVKEFTFHINRASAAVLKARLALIQPTSRSGRNS
jgi:DNA-binding transcriptional regulator YhcF (GntR family)